MRRIFPVVLVSLLAVGCSSGGFTPRLLQETSSYDRYVRSLEGVDLHLSVMGREWLTAGRGALARPEAMTLPWREELFFAPQTPTAMAWRVELRRGQKLRAVLARSAGVGVADAAGSPYFLELFEQTDPGSAPRLVTEADGAGRLEHDIDRDGVFVLRVQPELLTGGRAVLEVTGGGQLEFPVAGKDARAIGSGFGDPRDGGRRRHEGVDIFAPRGTLAVAAVDGVVTRVGNNRLGGRVVWMRGGGKSFYYAHLDEQLAGVGPIEAGEPVGRVGNTGNARSTPPHLHFGLFAGGGALDPAPYLARAGEPPAVTADLGRLGRPARVASARARLRSGPSTAYEIRDELTRHTALELEGAALGWYRVRLADGRRGFMAGSLVEAATEPVRRLASSQGDELLYYRPSPTAPEIRRVPAGERPAVLAELGDFALVRLADATVGWLALARSPGERTGSR